MTEKHLLQGTVALAGLVPVLAGAGGILWPDHLFAAPLSAMTHAAYLHGLLLGLGLAFWSLVPAIERKNRAFSLLTGIVVLGGLARALTAVRLDIWGPSVTLPLVMELGVAPALWLWQQRVSKNTPSGLRT